MIVDTKDFDCPTCRHHRFGKCDTWCDYGEAYEPDLSKLKLKAINISELWNNDLDVSCRKLEALVLGQDEEFNKHAGSYDQSSFCAGYLYAIKLMRSSMKKEDNNGPRESNQSSP